MKKTITDTSKMPEKDLSSRWDKQYSKEMNDRILCLSPSLPNNMMVELTNACNHTCIFCTSSNMTRKIARMDEEFLISLMNEAHQEGVEEIGFYTTGEPFVHKKLVLFVAEAKRIGFRYTYISTNGALATPERAKRLMDAGIDSIKFSINASSRETYKVVHGKDEWDLVMSNLRYISEYRKILESPPKLFVTSIMTKITIDEQNSLLASIGDLVDEIKFVPIHNQSGQMLKAEGLLKPNLPQTTFKSDNICMMPFNRLHVSCEGYLTLCCVDYQNYLTVADLKNVSLREAWSGEVFQDMRRHHLEQRLEGTLCGNCWQGRSDNIAPLIPDHATVVDFSDIQIEVEEKLLSCIISDLSEKK